jgi:Zn finger protein HypA/HybF involved in hydrogenase expression
MKTTAQIVKIGTGHYISIPVQLRNIMNLSAGDLVEIDLSIPEEEKIKSYECLCCLYHFDANFQEEPCYCPSCGNEDEELIVEVRNGDKK